MHVAITCDTAPKAIGPYSQAVRAGQFLFLSGQVPIDAATGTLVDGDIEVQTHCLMRNIGEILKTAGTSYHSIVRTTVFLADMADFAAMNLAYGSYFRPPAPARATVQVARLPKDARIEIDVIAFVADE